MTGHGERGGVVAPRAQAGPNPQHLLATLLGEYLDSADAHLPAGAVVAMLGEFGVTVASARAALARLVRRNLLARRGGGRATVYHLTPQAIAVHLSTMHGFLRFGAEPPPWDGRWTVVAFSLPQSRQAERNAVRRVLGSSGFVRLYDSLWVSPRGDVPTVRGELDALLGEVDDARWSVMRARFEEGDALHGPVAAYDLVGLAARYQGFVDEYAPLREAVRAGAVDAAQALVARTTLMDSWRRLPPLDPDLPAEVLPSPWPRDDARALFIEVHRALGPLAERRLVEVMTPAWPDAAAWVTHCVAAGDPAVPPCRNVSGR